jgi:hypothetical protein
MITMLYAPPPLPVLRTFGTELPQCHWCCGGERLGHQTLEVITLGAWHLPSPGQVHIFLFPIPIKVSESGRPQPAVDFFSSRNLGQAPPTAAAHSVVVVSVTMLFENFESMATDDDEGFR